MMGVYFNTTICGFLHPDMTFAMKDEEITINEDDDSDNRYTAGYISMSGNMNIIASPVEE